MPTLSDKFFFLFGATKVVLTLESTDTQYNNIQVYCSYNVRVQIPKRARIQCIHTIYIYIYTFPRKLYILYTYEIIHKSVQSRPLDETSNKPYTSARKDPEKRDNKNVFTIYRRRLKENGAKKSTKNGGLAGTANRQSYYTTGEMENCIKFMCMCAREERSTPFRRYAKIASTPTNIRRGRHHPGAAAIQFVTACVHAQCAPNDFYDRFRARFKISRVSRQKTKMRRKKKEKKYSGK